LQVSREARHALELLGGLELPDRQRLHLSVFQTP
jgi:hypothetical protein